MSHFHQHKGRGSGEDKGVYGTGEKKFFAGIEPFKGQGFDWCVKLIGSGAPKLIIPVKSTKIINQRLADGWQMSKTIRMGLRKRRLWIDFIFEKERPRLRTEGKVVGMDSNYKNSVPI